eukprot:g60400.t1
MRIQTGYTAVIVNVWTYRLRKRRQVYNRQTKILKRQVGARTCEKGQRCSLMQRRWARLQRLAYHDSSRLNLHYR